MAVVVTGPDGAKITFPDGMDESAVNKAMAQAYPKGGDTSVRTPSSASPGAQPVVSPGNSGGQPPSHSDFGLGVWSGVKLPIDNASVAVEAGLRTMGVPVDKVDQWLADHGMGSGTATGTAQAMRDKDVKYLADQKAKGRTPSITGSLLGSIPTAAALALATKNPLLLGAATGALQSDAPDVRGVAKDAAFGAAFGKAGQVGAKAVATIAKPIFRPVVNKLLREGVKLTPGQMAGGTTKTVEDSATSFPVLGDVIEGAHNTAIKSFNVAAYNRALAPLGETFPKNVQPGHQGVAYLQDRFGKAYDALYPKMAIEYDEPLHEDLKGLGQEAMRNLPPDKARIFTNIMQDEIARPLISGQRGGRAALYPADAGQVQTPVLKRIDQKLNSLYRQYAGSDDPDNQTFAAYLNEAKARVHDAVERFHPELAKQLQKIDSGYSVLTKFEPAAARSPGGVFSGPQLATATRTADLSVRKRASAAGKAQLQDLADAGQQVLRPSIGNSGTASRHFVGGAIGAALFGKALGFSLNPLAAGGVGAALAPYTRVGGNIVRAALTKRPPGAGAVRKLIEKTAVPASIATPITTQRRREENK